MKSLIDQIFYNGKSKLMMPYNNIGNDNLINPIEANLIAGTIYGPTFANSTRVRDHILNVLMKEFSA